MSAELEGRAVSAARAVANGHGLTVKEAVVLSSRSNVIVHLRPVPVVARVMTGTVALHDDPEKWLKREVSVLRFLAPSRLAVAPSSLLGPGPYQHDGLWMTFSEWVPDAEHRSNREDANHLGGALRTLHEELRGFDGDLGGLPDLRDDIRRLHGRLAPSDSLATAQVSSLDRRLEALDDVVFRSTLPAQALHGDVSLSNLFRTPRGFVWNDFEDTFRGPIHWDVASYVGSLRSRGMSPSFVARMLEGYGWDDEQALAPFILAQEVYDEIWQMYDNQRRRA